MSARPHPAAAPRAQCGSVTVELAFICILLAVILFWTFGVGRYLWQYNRVVAAANAGGNYLSAAPWTDARLAAARQLIKDRITEDLGADAANSVIINCPCDTVTCTQTDSTLSKLQVTVPFKDPLHLIFPASVSVKTQVTVPNAH